MIRPDNLPFLPDGALVLVGRSPTGGLRIVLGPDDGYPGEPVVVNDNLSELDMHVWCRSLETVLAEHGTHRYRLVTVLDAESTKRLNAALKPERHHA
ncbi:hypothetical protein Tamer19_16490 [Cupriavidus sp. TA19]|uniref:hypothetical protein n=1 Tax=unclassified Cupriavidus TaxID=2640874 RepID=UPI00272944B1|nr:hypothetical protein [Cupriavidus sp. TA19]GLC92241.1 hypothetical protein Tamer19_16490 [Cupriavidus sp. TA19]